MEIKEIIHDDPQEDENIYRSYLTLKSATVENVGRYYCVFNESIKEDEYEYEYEEQVLDYKASSIYVYVNGKVFCTRN